MSRILVFGGFGFLGRNIGTKLVADGHEVIFASRGRPDGRSTSERKRSLPLLLEDTQAIKDAVLRHRIEVVLHLASSLIPSSSEEEYLLERRSVIEPTVKLASMLSAAGKRLVFVSSGGAVYGTSSVPCTETAECLPISFYGQAKLELEGVLRFYGRAAGLDYLILRPSNPYGRHQPLHGKQGLIAVVLGKLLKAGSLDVWGDGSVVRDYIYVDDFSSAVSHLIGFAPSGLIVNVGSGAGHSLLQVVHEVERATGRSVPLRFRPGRLVDVPSLILDVSLARSLGVPQARPLADGVAAFAAEVRSTRDFG